MKRSNAKLCTAPARRFHLVPTSSPRYYMMSTASEPTTARLPRVDGRPMMRLPTMDTTVGDFLAPILHQFPGLELRSGSEHACTVVFNEYSERAVKSLW